MEPDLSWLIGHRIKEIDKQDYTWFFTFDDGSTVYTEGPWRVARAEGIVVTSTDDGHTFGLSTPVDASQRTMERITNGRVEKFEVDPRTGDLTLFLEGATTIQFLQLSCGYESWSTIYGSQRVVCSGGGRLWQIDQTAT